MASKCPSTSYNGNTYMYVLLADAGTDSANASLSVDSDGYLCCATETCGGNAVDILTQYITPCGAGIYAPGGESYPDPRAGCTDSGAVMPGGSTSNWAGLDSDPTVEDIGLDFVYDAMYSSLGGLDTDGFLIKANFGVATLEGYLDPASEIQDGDVGVFYQYLVDDEDKEVKLYYAVTENTSPLGTISDNYDVEEVETRDDVLATLSTPGNQEPTGEARAVERAPKSAAAATDESSGALISRISVFVDSSENAKIQERLGNIEGGSISEIISSKVQEWAAAVISTSVVQQKSFKKVVSKPFNKKNVTALTKDISSLTTTTTSISSGDTMVTGGSY